MMHTRQNQRGMTLWGTALVILVAVFFAFLFVKLFTPYLNDFKVRAALDGTASQADIGILGTEGIITALDKRFMIDDITNVNLRKDLTVEFARNTKIIRLDYEVRVPMALNITALLAFSHQREVPSEAASFE